MTWCKGVTCCALQGVAKPNEVVKGAERVKGADRGVLSGNKDLSGEDCAGVGVNASSEMRG